MENPCGGIKIIIFKSVHSNMKKLTPITFLIAFSCLFLSCNSYYQAQSLQYKSYRVSGNEQADSSLVLMLRPYAENLYKSMNDVVGWADESLDKKQPEGALGNFMVDAFLTMARENYQVPVDIAILNNGGIRLTQLPKGEVTRGKVFELMPFDNLLILQKIKGDVLQQLLDKMAGAGGWPVAGMSMQIKAYNGQAGKKAVNVLIGGKPLDQSQTYTMANSDFLANGGDNLDMLRSIPQISNGYLMRDAIIDYIYKLKSEGKNIRGKVENRVTYVE